MLLTCVERDLATNVSIGVYTPNGTARKPAIAEAKIRRRPPITRRFTIGIVTRESFL